MKQIAKILVFMLVIVSVFLPYSYSYGQTKVRTAEITDFAGSADIMKSGSEKVFDAEKGMKLTHGDRIITGKASWVTLDVDGDKEIKVGEKTYISLEELTYDDGGEKTGIKLFNGKLWSNIKKKLSKDDEFEVRTPNAIMGARGTKFLVSYADSNSDTTANENKSRLTVMEGTVQALATATVKVKDNNGNLVEKQLTIAIAVEEGENVELIKEKIQKELQSIADEVQEKGQDGEVDLADIQKAIEGRISQDEMETMNVKKLDFEELDSFSIETILYELNNGEQTDETKEAIHQLRNVLDTVKKEEHQNEQRQEKLINQVRNSANVVYGGTGGGTTGTSSTSSAPANAVVPTGISLPQDQQEIVVSPESTRQLTPSVLPADATDKSLTWTTSNSDVATVNDGLITARGLGYATITAKTVSGGVTAVCNVIVTNGSSPFILETGKTVDSDHNGIVDKIQLFFSDTIDKNSISIGDISVIPENDAIIGGITSASVNPDAGNVLDLVVEEEIDGERLNYNTGATAVISVPAGAVRSVSEDFSGTGGVYVRDGAGPVLLGWEMDFNENEKHLRLIFSEPMVTSGHIDTTKILVTDENSKSPIAVNQSVSSSTNESDGSFVADIVFPLPDVPAGILDLEPSGGNYYLELNGNAFQDTAYNFGVLLSGESLLECSKYTADVTKPVVTGVANSGSDSILISFSELIDADQITYAKTGDVEFAGNASVLSGDKDVQLGISNLTNGDTITISGVSDLSGNNMEEETYRYTGTEWTTIQRPYIVGGEAVGQAGIGNEITVTVTFSTPMNPDTVVTDNLIYNGASCSPAIHSVQAADSDYLTFIIVLSSTACQGNEIEFSSNVTDAAGNSLASPSKIGFNNEELWTVMY